MLRSIEEHRIKISPEKEYYIEHMCTNMWIYKCDAGTYTEDSFFKLLYAIFTHRFGHFLKGEGFKD